MAWNPLMQLGAASGVPSHNRAQLDALATTSGLCAGGLYLLSDEGRLAVGLSAGSYAVLARLDDLSPSGFDDVLQALSADTSVFDAWAAQDANLARLSAWLNAPSGFALRNPDLPLGHLFRLPQTMELLMSSADALASLSGDDSAWPQFATSTAKPEVSIPLMTAVDQPSGRITASGQNGPYAPVQAFDRGANLWIPGGGEPTWIGYQFDQPVFIHTFEMKVGSLGYPLQWRLSHSDDGTAWTHTLEVDNDSAQDGVTRAFRVAAAGRHAWWRLTILRKSGFSAIDELQLRGFA